MPDSMPRYPVVIVEDDEVFRSVAVDYLEDFGWTVVEADSVASGITAIKKSLPCVVLCDYRLPDGSGSEILKSVDRSRCAFLVVTAEGEPELAFRTLFEGADNFLTKPIREAAVLNEEVRKGNATLHAKLGS